jgi:hypothetical protein
VRGSPISPEATVEILALAASGLSMQQIAEKVGRVKSTIFKVLKSAGKTTKASQTVDDPESYVGKTFGRITIVGVETGDKHGHRRTLLIARCVCKTEKKVRVADVRKGDVTGKDCKECARQAYTKAVEQANSNPATFTEEEITKINRAIWGVIGRLQAEKEAFVEDILNTTWQKLIVHAASTEMSTGRKIASAQTIARGLALQTLRERKEEAARLYTPPKPKDGEDEEDQFEILDVSRPASVPTDDLEMCALETALTDDERAFMIEYMNTVSPDRASTKKFEALSARVRAEHQQILAHCEGNLEGNLEGEEHVTRA